MSKNKNNNEAEVKVEEALSKTEKFFETYKKHFIYSILAIVVAIALGFAYHQFISLPKQQDAMAQTFTAEQYFRADDFEKALNGDGSALGFKQIISDYGSNAGEAIYFYAGVCELQLGKYNEAIDYLKKYKSGDKIISARALCCIGDAYAGLNNLNEAVNYFKKAADLSDDIFSASYLLKAGIIYEEMGDKAKALQMYEDIKAKYPQSVEGYEINKYISRLK